MRAIATPPGHRDPTPYDVALAAALAGASVVTAWITGLPDGEPDLTLAAGAVLIVSGVVLVWRRRFPVAVWAATGAAFTVYGAFEWPDPLVPFGAFAALVTVVELSSRRVAAAVLVGSAAGAVAALSIPGDSDAGDWSIAVLGLVVSPIVGLTFRERASRVADLQRRNQLAEHERGLAVAAARQAERRRIARELHDVVTHHVTLLVIQAEAGASVAGGADARRFDAIADSGRSALRDLRQLLGVLREDDAGAAREHGQRDAPINPSPDFDRIDELVERSRAAGLDVTCTVAPPTEPVQAAVELAAYRIVQEGLTNVLRHANAQHALVAVGWTQGAVTVEVVDDGRAGAGAEGNGLTGLRERVALLGGRMEAGPQPLGGYRLHASIPIAPGPAGAGR